MTHLTRITSIHRYVTPALDAVRYERIGVDRVQATVPGIGIFEFDGSDGEWNLWAAAHVLADMVHRRIEGLPLARLRPSGGETDARDAERAVDHWLDTQTSMAVGATGMAMHPDADAIALRSLRCWMEQQVELASGDRVESRHLGNHPGGSMPGAHAAC